MSIDISRREWLAVMLASLPGEVSSEIKATPESFKIVSGVMGENSCRYLYGPGEELLAYSINWWNGEWAMVHEITQTPPSKFVLDNAPTILQLLGRDELQMENLPPGKPDDLPS